MSWQPPLPAGGHQPIAAPQAQGDSSGSSAGSSGYSASLSSAASASGHHPSQPLPQLPYAPGYSQQHAGAQHVVHRGAHHGAAHGIQRGGGHATQRGGIPAHQPPPPAMNPQWQQPIYTRGAQRPGFVGRGFLPPGGNAPYVSAHTAPQQQARAPSRPIPQTVLNNTPVHSGGSVIHSDVVPTTPGLSDASSSEGPGQPGSATMRCTLCAATFHIANEAQHMLNSHGIRI